MIVGSLRAGEWFFHVGGVNGKALMSLITCTIQYSEGEGKGSATANDDRH